MRRRGFTLIEIVVAAAILAIIAVAMIPRLTSMGRRQGDVLAERISDLLTMFAHRESLGVQQVGLWHDSQAGTLSVLVMDVNPDDPDAPPAWRPDRMVEPVLIPDGFAVDEIIVDGQPEDGADEWMVTSTPAGGRPSLELRLVGDGVDIRLLLPSSGFLPLRVDLDESGEPRQETTTRVEVDLDDSGRDHEPW